MFQSWLKRQIILAAILVPLASSIFIISIFIINQIFQQQAVAFNISLLITIIILVAIFIRLYQINFFAIAKNNSIRKFIGNFKTSSLLQHPILLVVILISSAAIFTLGFKSEKFFSYVIRTLIPPLSLLLGYYLGSQRVK